MISLFLFVCFNIVLSTYGFQLHNTKYNINRSSQLNMALDSFIISKLESIKRTFAALTERLSDPDVSNDRKQMLTLSRERASLEDTVEAFLTWQGLEEERLVCA